MSREWFAVHCALIRKPRFRRLSDAAQLTLLYAWALAGDQTPEATWRDDDELADSLELVARPRESVEELRSAGWIETADTETGPHTRLRDWDRYQMAGTVAARNAWQASYMKDWRKTKATRGSKENTEQDNIEHDITRLTTSGLPVVNAGDWHTFTNPVWADFREAWIEYGLRLPPTMKQRPKLFEIVRDYPTLASDWIRSAPQGLNAYDLVAWLFRRHATAISGVPPDELTQSHQPRSNELTRLAG